MLSDLSPSNNIFYLFSLVEKIGSLGSLDSCRSDCRSRIVLLLPNVGVYCITMNSVVLKCQRLFSGGLQKYFSVPATVIGGLFQNRSEMPATFFRRSSRNLEIGFGASDCYGGLFQNRYSEFVVPK